MPPRSPRGFLGAGSGPGGPPVSRPWGERDAPADRARSRPSLSWSDLIYGVLSLLVVALVSATLLGVSTRLLVELFLIGWRSIP